MARQLVRNVRAVGAENLRPLATMKRSMTAGPKTTSARSSRPVPAAKLAARLAANNSALARALVAGAARATTSRVKPAASAGTMSLCQRAMTEATCDGAGCIPYIYCVR
jgi:hypothetical protein